MVTAVFCELRQNWGSSETYEDGLKIMEAHFPYGIEERFIKDLLGRHGEEKKCSVAV